MKFPSSKATRSSETAGIGWKHNAGYVRHFLPGPGAKFAAIVMIFMGCFGIWGIFAIDVSLPFFLLGLISFPILLCYALGVLLMDLPIATLDNEALTIKGLGTSKRISRSDFVSWHWDWSRRGNIKVRVYILDYRDGDLVKNLTVPRLHDGELLLWDVLTHIVDEKGS